LPAKQAKIAVFSRKAKTTGVSTKCIFAFDSPPISRGATLCNKQSKYGARLDRHIMPRSRRHASK